jgi:hypothetical protein
MAMTVDQQRAIAIAQAKMKADQTARGTAEMSAITQSMGNAPEGNPVAQANRAQYDQLPGYAKPFVAANDVLQTFANGATFGFGDKAVAAARAPFTDKSYGQELAAARSKTEEARQRAGGAGLASELTGAVATPTKLAGQGLTLAGRAGTAAMQGLPGLLARTGLMGAEGAGYGTLTAAGNDQNLGTGAALGAAGGAAGNLIGEGISAGVGKVAGMFNKKPPIPSMDELNALKTAAYEKADQAGVVYTPDAVSKLSGNIKQVFADRGFLPANEPGAAAVLNQIDNLQGQNVTLKGLDTLRKMAGNAYIQGNKSNNALTSEIINQIDNLMTSPGSKDVLMGDAQAGMQALSQARNLASRTIKAEKIGEAMSKADLRASSTGSGGNVDNATRQNLRRILEKPRGYTPDERAALEKVVRGTPTQNALRLAGKLSPSGNGLMAALGIGGTMVNPMVGLASLGGMGAKTVADSMTGMNAQQLLNIIAAGGNASAAQAAPNAIQRLAQSERIPLSRLLMALGVKESVAP